jgi:hypothetical protein
VVRPCPFGVESSRSPASREGRRIAGLRWSCQFYAPADLATAAWPSRVADVGDLGPVPMRFQAAATPQADARFSPASADEHELSGHPVAVAIHECRNLAPGARIPGPAIIGEDQTSSVVTRPFDAAIDAFGYIDAPGGPQARSCGVRSGHR